MSFAGMAAAQTTYIDFEDGGVNECREVYHYGDGLHTDLLIENQVTDPLDENNRVLKFDKATSSWGGWDRISIILDQPMDVASSQKFSFRAMSPDVATTVRFKVNTEDEQGVVETNNVNEVLDLAITEPNTWYEFVVDFSDQASSFNTELSYTRIDIFFTPGDGNPGTFYIDDVKGPDFSMSTSVAFSPEDGQVDIFPFEMIDDEYQSQMTITANQNIRNIDDSAIENSDLNSIVYLKTGDVDVPFSATITDSKIITITPTEFMSTSTSYTYGVYADMVEFEINESVLTETATFTTTTEELQYPPYTLPLSFELGNIHTVGFDGGSAVVIENADQSGVNSSAHALELTRLESGASWAGIIIYLDEPIDFSTQNTVKFDIYTEIAAGAVIIFKLESTTGADALELKVPTTTSSEWETIEIDCSEVLSGVYDKIVLIPNMIYPDAPGPGEVFLFDNIAQFDPNATSIDNVAQNNLLIYPNPTTGTLHMSNVDGETAKVFSLTGQLVHQATVTQGVVSVDHLNNGVYFVQVDQSICKIVKQ